MNERRDNLAAASRATERVVRHSRRAFTLVELLAGMALLVMVMTAAALAMQGAADAGAYSRDKSRSLTQAALALNRLSTDIRRAASIELNTAHTITLVLPDGEQRQYTWSAAPYSSLMFASDTNPNGNVLVPEVVDFTLTEVTAYSEIADDVVAVSVTVTLEVSYGGATTRLETTVKPRRNIL